MNTYYNKRMNCTFNIYILKLRLLMLWTYIEWYYITTYNSGGLESAQCPPVSATPLPIIPPAQVVNLRSSGYDKRVELKWDANQDSDIFMYYVYRSQTPGFTPDDSTKIAQVRHNVNARRQMIYF